MVPYTSNPRIWEAEAGQLTQVQPYPLTENKAWGADCSTPLKMMQLRQSLPNTGEADGAGILKVQYTKFRAQATALPPTRIHKNKHQT